MITGAIGLPVWSRAADPTRQLSCVATRRSTSPLATDQNSFGRSRSSFVKRLVVRQLWVLVLVVGGGRSTCVG